MRGVLVPRWLDYVASRVSLGASPAELTGPLADAWRCGAAAVLDAVESGELVEARAELAAMLGDAELASARRPYAS